MKIAYLINSGVELHSQNSPLLRVKEIVDRLRNRRHRVTFVALDKRQVILTDDWDVNQYARSGWSAGRPFNLFESGIRRLQGTLHLPYLALFDSYRFYETCAINLAGYDVLHERCGLFGMGGLWASRRLRIPFALDVEADLIKELSLLGTPLRGFQKWYAALVFRRTLEAATAISSISQVLKDALVAQWGVAPGKIFVIPNGVDTERFKPSQPCESLKTSLGIKDEVVVTFVGGFYPWHGIEMLIDAFREAVGEATNVKLLLVGDGFLMPVILEKIAQNNLAGSVILTGQVEHRAVPEYLSISDICVAPYPELDSHIWFSPMKVYEYMAAGKAILASGTGQISDVIQHGLTGLLVESGNVEQLSKALVELIRDPALRDRLGRNARQQAVEQHSWDHHLDQWEALYTHSS